jgi:UDP-N-acetylglucosamine/UDP-N-acetylgalactosamine diphosphorylase
MFKERITELLTTLGQTQLLKGIDELSPTQLDVFYSQLKKFDLQILKRQRETLFHSSNVTSSLKPLQTFEQSGSLKHTEIGKELLSQGKVGCLILAGGHGSRLGSKEPKGTLPLSPIKGKSLFQIFLEKALAASRRYGTSLPVAIMTSPLNYNQTSSYLAKHNHFGLEEKNCSFFAQGTLPLLDDAGNWLLESPGVLAEGADGNGEALTRFFQSEIFEAWKKRGISYVNLILIDNPLADPFDAELVGYHASSHAEVTLKAIVRLQAEEKVGVIGMEKNKIRVIEYSELDEAQKHGVNPDGSLEWKIANTSLFCVSMEFIEKLSKNPRVYLPWHLAQKNAEIWTEETKKKAEVWKCETFIFDILAFAQKVSVLVYPRERIFAPWKNAEGEHGLESVQQSLMKVDAEVWSSITGKKPPERPFELSQEFHYPSAELIQKWKGKEFPAIDYLD